jgi:rubrerythrin
MKFEDRAASIRACQAAIENNKYSWPKDQNYFELEEQIKYLQQEANELKSCIKQIKKSNRLTEDLDKYKAYEQTYDDVDEFLCPYCGLHLTEWMRLIYDEDLNEMELSEYQFKFCPNCGRKI